MKAYNFIFTIIRKESSKRACGEPFIFPCYSPAYEVVLSSVNKLTMLPHYIQNLKHKFFISHKYPHGEAK